MFSLQKDIRVKLGKRVPKEEAPPHGFKDIVRPDSLRSPTVIAVSTLGGLGAMDANGMAKTAQMLLKRTELFNNEVQFLGTYDQAEIDI